ncbi:tetratricopeptide repeat protein [Paludisphaera sp.]|uniref:tetratricopeptide repeat protein n=1 Tax=Paludisphaera sp. TaxID=2017432 RepID=UPI00301D5E13
MRIDRLLIAILVPAALLCGGCHGGPRRRGEHASARLLDTGPGARVTKRQAADVEIAMGRAMEESGDLAGAEDAYARALAKDPRRADAEARLAVLAHQRGDEEASDRHFAAALKLAPDDPEILCDRGYSLYLRRSWADAEAHFRKALDRDPRHARAHNNLGLTQARRGDRDEALAAFARAGLDPADAHANLALATAMEGRMDEARELYAAAVAAKPDSPGAREGLRAADAALASRGAPATARLDPAVARASAPSP